MHAPLVSGTVICGKLTFRCVFVYAQSSHDCNNCLCARQVCAYICVKHSSVNINAPGCAHKRVGQPVGLILTMFCIMHVLCGLQHILYKWAHIYIYIYTLFMRVCTGISYSFFTCSNKI